MNDLLLWSLLLLTVTTVLLVLPFYPAWSEWRRPRDRQPQAVEPPAALDTGPRALQLAPGACFNTVHARHLMLGSGAMPAPSVQPTLQRWQPPAGARPWGLHGWHIGHHLDIPANQLVPCSLVVRGRLRALGPGRIEGDIKARDGLHLGPGTELQGNLFCEGDVWLDAGCSVSGLVMAEGSLHLAPGVVIGTPQHPVSVCADVMDVRGPVLVHGSVQARIRGSVACA